MAAVEDQAGLFGADGRRVRNGDGGVVEVQLTLQTSLPRVAQHAVERSGHVQFGRQICAHVTGEIENGAGGKTIPIEGHAPVRLGKIIRATEAHGEGQRFAARGAGFHFHDLGGHVEAAGQAQGPALAVGRHAVPAMDAFDVQIAGDADIVERAGQMHARGDGAMHAGIEAVQQRDDLADGAFFQAHVEIKAARAGLGPAAACDELAESVGGLVGAGRLAGELDFPCRRAAGRRGDIQVRVHEIEDGLGVAELEVDASRADVEFRDGADDGAAEQRLEVPAAGLGRASGLGHIDAGIVQAYGGDFEVTAEQRGKPRYGFERADIGDGLDADGGVFVDDDVIDFEAGSGEEAEMDGTQFNFAPQSTFQSCLDARCETVAA